MFWILGKKKLRILIEWVEYDKFDIKSKLKRERYYSNLNYERYILKNYAFVFIYFIFFCSKIFSIIYIFCIIFFFFYQVKLKFFSFFLLSLIYLCICFVFVYLVNFLFFFFEFLYWLGQHRVLFFFYLKNINIFFWKIIKFFFILVCLLYLYLYRFLKYIYYFLIYFVLNFIKIFYIINFNLLIIFFKLIYLFILVFFSNVYILFFLFFFVFQRKQFIKFNYDIKFLNIFNWNLKKRKKMFIFFFKLIKKLILINFKFINTKEGIDKNLKIKIFKLGKIVLNSVFKLIGMLQLFWKLIFFFSNTKFFTDRYRFLAWEDEKRPAYDYWNYTVIYHQVKYYADRKYFGFAAFFFWKLYIFQYEILIPLSYYLHKWDWQWELYELQIFNFIEHTEVEETLLFFYKYWRYYFFLEKSFINRKNLVYDFFFFFWFFLIEDLFLYYTQIELLIKYYYKYCIIFFKLVISNCQNIYFFVKIFFNFFNFFNFKKKSLILRNVVSIYLLLNLIYIYLQIFFFKIKKNFVNFKKVLNFCFLKKDITFFIKLKIFFSFFVFKIYNILILKFKKFYKKEKNLYYLNNFLKLKENYWLFLLIDRRVYKIDSILFQNYKNEQLYKAYKRVFYLKNCINIFLMHEEKIKLYEYLNTIKLAFIDWKDTKDLTWLDYLTGKNAGQVRLNYLYKRYRFLKLKKKKIKINKFRLKKNSYFFLLKKDKDKKK